MTSTGTGTTRSTSQTINLYQSGPLPTRSRRFAGILNDPDDQAWALVEAAGALAAVGQTLRAASCLAPVFQDGRLAITALPDQLAVAAAADVTQTLIEVIDMVFTSGPSPGFFR